MASSLPRPVPAHPHSLAVRWTRLLMGLLLYGITMGLLVRASVGLDPWDVLHEGLTHHVPLTFGQVTIAVGALVLLLWWPLRQRPGIGTVLNVALIGTAADLTLAVVPTPDALAARIALLIIGVVGNALAGALYLSAAFGAGPRDGLWRGIVARTGLSVRRVRTTLEVTVLGLGWLLGGTVGIGTVVYAIAIGPLVQMFLGWLEPATIETGVPRWGRAAGSAPGRDDHRGVGIDE